MSQTFPAMLPLLSGGGIAWNDPSLWAVIDFVVLVVLLVKFAGPPIGKVFASKQQSIARAVAESERTLAEAERVLDEHQRNAQGEAVALADIAKHAAALAASLVVDFDRETAAEVARAKEAALAAIERERMAAVASVRAEILAAAFAEAERSIRTSLDLHQQRAMFASFAAKAQEVRP